MANRKPKPKTDMREMLREKAALAQTFADDGAYHSAARVLLELADTIKIHAVAKDAELKRFLARKAKA